MTPGDLVVRNIGRLTTWSSPVVTDSALVIRNGVVAWSGRDVDLPSIADCDELDAGGRAVIPGFVDSHTHAVFAGNRRDELVARIEGEKYAAGGISSTVAATARASDELLLEATSDRLRSMLRSGTTTVEIKSGYAPDPAGEIRLLGIASAAAHAVGVDVELTYLGAHVVPGGHDPDDYVAEVIDTLPAAAAEGAHWCDVFCDRGAFTVDQSRQILLRAKEVGLGLRIHAEQLEDTGAAELAAAIGCTSADHLERISDDAAAALAASGVVATLVPIAGLQTHDGGGDHYRRLAAAGATIALATDCNPGTAWSESMPLAIQLACWLWGMGVTDALRAATLGGATGLRRPDVGHLGVGAAGDLIVLDSDHEADLAVHPGSDLIGRVVRRGVSIET